MGRSSKRQVTQQPLLDVGAADAGKPDESKPGDTNQVASGSTPLDVHAVKETRAEGQSETAEAPSTADHKASSATTSNIEEPREADAPRPSTPPRQPPSLRKCPGKKLYQDEIYGTKELSSLAVAIIDTPEFQRLGHICQLGFTYTVFRGANHRRFDHSVGTYFRVRTLLRRLVQNHARLFSSNQDDFRHPGLWLSPRLYVPAPGTPIEKQISGSPMGRWRGLVEIVSAAALLHDLGHVPAGHTLEDEFNIFDKHDGLGAGRFFQMFYGPRKPKTKLGQITGAPTVADFFDPIDDALLPRPECWERVPLPWVFEDGTYFPFLSTESTTEVLANSVLRDMIYLILSFKDKIEVDEHKTEYVTFDKQIDLAVSKFGDDSHLDDDDLLRKRRVQFIRALYDYYATPHATDDESKPLYYPFMSDAVGNTICADLLDYLVRDGKRLKLDIRDNPRLQRYLVVRPDRSLVSSSANGNASEPNRPNLRLTIYAVHAPPGELQRRDTVSDLLDLMRERYRFAEIVYYHPKKAAFSAMLAKAMELLGPDQRPADDETVYPAPWTLVPRKTQPHLAHFGDDSLIQYIASSDKASITGAGKLCQAITYRAEYKLLYTLDYDAATAAGGTTKFLEDLRKHRDEGRRQRERELAALLERDGLWTQNAGEPPPILIYCPNLRMQAKEVEARVELKSGYAKSLNLHRDDATLREELRISNEKYQRLWRLYLFIHPRACADLDAETRALVLSSVVDAFCHRYDIPTEHRTRGCRFYYTCFTDRVDKFFEEWIQKNGREAWPRENVRNAMSTFARMPGFWQDIPGSGITGYPLMENGYYSGFRYLAQIVAANSANVSEKDNWTEVLKEFRNRDWFTKAESTKKETLRQQAREVFQILATVKDTAASDPVNEADWEQVRRNTIAQLARINERS